jgi:Ca2+/Na+ antiporter
MLAKYVVYILVTYVFYIATKKKKEEENRNNAHTAPTTRNLEAPGGRVLDAPSRQLNTL